jgi:hypothetical protein
MGMIVAAALVTTHRMQVLLAVWMMAVAGVKGQGDDMMMAVVGMNGQCDYASFERWSIDIRPLAHLAAAMMLGMIIGHMTTRSTTAGQPRSTGSSSAPSAPSGASASASAGTRGAAPSGAPAAASASVSPPAGALEAASSPAAPSPTQPTARHRVKQVYHTDSRATMVHVDSQCQQLRNRSNRLITRSVCSVCSGGMCLD